MTTEAPTIAQTVSEIHRALSDYIEATYHIGDPRLIAQRRALMEEDGVIARAPFIESTPRYETARRFADLSVDPAVKQLFAKISDAGTGRPLVFDPPYTHQADALEYVLRDGSSLAVTTGTGSGKTETFLLPMLGKLAVEAAHSPESFAEPAMRAMVLYPMNALVNDQLGRLRLLFGDPRVREQFSSWAGRPARFARYTSRSLYPGTRTVKRDQKRLAPIQDFYIDLLERSDDVKAPGHTEAASLLGELKRRGKWPAKPDLRTWYGAKNAHWQKAGEYVRAVRMQDDAELITRHEVLDAPPDVLITNYSMLEYMMMRPLERPVFDATRRWLHQNPDEKFLLVVDEAHLYRGAAGAEVGLLIRRLRARLGITAERMQVITTSASFQDQEYARQFAAQLTGKSVQEFQRVGGKLAYRSPDAAGTIDDAELLADVSVRDLHEATGDAKIRAVESVLTARGTRVERGRQVEALLYDALESFAPLNRLINETMQRARPLSELAAAVFPGVDSLTADRAITTLVALGSTARHADGDIGLLPCRVHAFYRGLPGLWACSDADCPLAKEDSVHQLGPVGKLFSQPRTACRCGARVYELFTCRDCGSTYLRAYTDDLTNPTSLWQEAGGSLQAASGGVQELHALDLLVEEPDANQQTTRADLDLVTGRLDPLTPGPRMRTVHLRSVRVGHVVSGPDEADDETSAGHNLVADGEFKPCGVCGKRAGFRSSVQNHLTKGDEPFQALVSRQIEVQPPSRPYDDFAPLRGRKVLTFSDSRQVAARLAPKLQAYATRDVIRPLIIRGWRDLSGPGGIGRQLSLAHLPLAAMVGAHRLSVRLRPELRPSESRRSMEDVARILDAGGLDGDIDARDELLALQIETPDALMRAIHTTLTDRFYGLSSLALASVRERVTQRAELLSALPDLPDVADDEDRKLALVRMWLAQWATSTVGIWFPPMTAEWRGTQDGVSAHAGKFRTVDRWLGTAATKRQFTKSWLPVLRSTFCDPAGDKLFLLADRVALELDGDWGYCERCRFTQRPFPGTRACVNCGQEEVRVLDPDSDTVFHARKGYYRASTIRALADPPEAPMSIVAAEHTAQLNAAQSNAVFSKAEEHELLFQDVNLGGSAASIRDRTAIDVLSCTTTMEVGIDIGALSGVALRNIPPSRANYQQRAGRAGRRGNSIATVVAFGSADTHDDQYFREPAEMIWGRVTDPTLTLNNPEIAQRHILAYLLQRYLQERLPVFDADSQSSQLFEVLGTVKGFVDPRSTLSRDDFVAWLAHSEAALRADLTGWLPDELSQTERASLLESFVTNATEAVDSALGTPVQNEAVALEGEPDENSGTDPVEATGDRRDEPAPHGQSTNLLNRLLDKGVLPRYAFPTDVANFYVFDVEQSERYRPVFRYSPSQGLPAALSQYAPGKEVWIDGKEWRSGAIYSPDPGARKHAWDARKLYFECSVCHYARHVELDDAARGEVRECPACGASDSFGKAMPWMVPPGFAHPAYEEPGTSPDDSPEPSYATRAKLVAPGSSDASRWQKLGEGIQQIFSREKLLVTNTGPGDEGYTYCFKCGRIEPSKSLGGEVTAAHNRPYPTDGEPMCPGGLTTTGLALGTDFITDVLLVRATVDRPVRLDPQLLSTQVALRTLAEAMTLAGTEVLGIDASELQAEYRPALTAGGAAGREAEIYLYDTLSGGAGFSRRIGTLGEEFLHATLRRLERCPDGCDQSCYRCLRGFRNRREHGLLDRRVGAKLLRYLLDGSVPASDPEDEQRSADHLLADLVGRDLPGVSFLRDVSVEVDGIGKVTAPILAQAGRRQMILGVHGPLTPGISGDDLLNQAKTTQSAIPVKLLDEIVIARSLPNASLQAEAALRWLLA